jgi:hypothetical protein
VKEGHQIVLFDDGLGKHPDGDLHVFVALHWCSEV